jgi:hypothetical protein
MSPRSKIGVLITACIFAMSLVHGGCGPINPAFAIPPNNPQPETRTP